MGYDMGIVRACCRATCRTTLLLHGNLERYALLHGNIEGYAFFARQHGRPRSVVAVCPGADGRYRDALLRTGRLIAAGGRVRGLAKCDVRARSDRQPAAKHQPWPFQPQRNRLYQLSLCLGVLVVRLPLGHV